MTQALEHAVAQVRRLPAREQDAIAAIIMAELADERRWQQTFQNTQAQLSRWAQKVGADIKAGKSRKMGFDEL